MRLTQGVDAIPRDAKRRGAALFARGGARVVSEDETCAVIAVDDSPRAYVTISASGRVSCDRCGNGRGGAEAPLLENGMKVDDVAELETAAAENADNAAPAAPDPPSEAVTGVGCAHMVAALLLARDSGLLERMRQRDALRAGRELLARESGIAPGDDVRVVPVLTPPDPALPDDFARLQLRVGGKRLYLVRDIAALLDALERGEPVVFSKTFTLEPSQASFTPDAQALLRLLAVCLAATAAPAASGKTAAPAATGKTAASAATGKTAAPAATGKTAALPPPLRARDIALREPFLSRVLDALAGMPFLLRLADGSRPQDGIEDVALPLLFEADYARRTLTIEASCPDDLALLTGDRREDGAFSRWSTREYAVYQGRVVRVARAQADWCRELQSHAGGRTRYAFSRDEAAQALFLLLPRMRACGEVVFSDALETRMREAPLTPRVYLDCVGGEITARVSFVYGAVTVNPFERQTDAPERVDAGGEEQFLLRDGEGENRVMAALSGASFYVRRGEAFLRDADAAYRFLTEGVAELQSCAEVYVSPAFERAKPRRLTPAFTMRSQGGRLLLSLREEGTEDADLSLLPILEALAKERSYVRLRDGAFLTLSHVKSLMDPAREILAAIRQDARGRDAALRGGVSLSSCRAAYLSAMLSRAGADVVGDATLQSLQSALLRGADSKLSGMWEKTLFSFQAAGVSFLMTLYRLGMGGILADEMGLGKTVQVIAALCAARDADGPALNMIVSPTSLVFNWAAELKRFAPHLRVLSATGARAAREIVEARAREDGAEQPDVLLMSYPVLRRDADSLRDLQLRFLVLDEAQYIKNARSQAAVAAKSLDARVRVALTGTPLENHAGELWSLVDFALPGYLFSYTSFLRRYGDGARRDELKERLRPFMLRRSKEEVLSSLPDKHETCVVAGMTEGQEKLYRALSARLKSFLTESDGGLPAATRADAPLPANRAQSEGITAGAPSDASPDAPRGAGRFARILTVLTQLRQVCCHPALCFPDYDGDSGKLLLLQEMLPSLLAEGRRVLLFSQFVGMLKLIRKRLALLRIPCLYLDGTTPPAERQALCDAFNAGSSGVFLISLRAGGTGLNLTGADTVIHFDPWWNPAVEQQATDRVHRIGQDKPVRVFRLVTGGTVEEKVVRLNERKRALFEELITTGGRAISTLSEKEIRALFADGA